MSRSATSGLGTLAQATIIGRLATTALAATIAVVPIVAVGPHRADAGARAADPSDVAASPTGRYLVRVANPARTQSTVERASGARVLQRLSAVRGAVVVEADITAAVALANSPGVVEVVPDQPMHLADEQADPTWSLDRIDQDDQPLDGTYRSPNAGAGVTVYVLDSGVYNHPDLGGRVAEGTSTIDSGIGRVDCNGHGTHVAGTVGSTTYGVAKAVSIVPIRVASCDGGLWLVDALEGVDWAIAHHTGGPAVLNASLGGPANSWWPQWVNAAVADGIVMVVAAGNQYGQSACNYSPANVPAAITVGSSEIDDWVSPFSNLGSCVDLFAPGGSIQSLAASGNGSASKSGTSMATPHVAGAAAQLLAAAPWLSPAQVAENLVATSSHGRLLGGLGGAPNLLLRVHPTIAPPANDSVGAAEPLDPWGAGLEASNRWTTRQSGEPAHAGLSGGGSVWFRTSVPLPGSLTLSTFGSSFDTLLAVYTGTPLTGLVPVIANDQAPGGGDWSAVTFNPIPGTTYWVAVDGRNGQRGDGTLTPSFIPTIAAPNDSFSAPSLIDPNRAGLFDTHTRGASREAGEPAHAGQPGTASLWWQFTAPADGQLVVSTQGSTPAVALAAYTGDTIATLAEVAADNGAAAGVSQLVVPTAAGTTYRIAVDGTGATAASTGGARLHTAFIADGTDRYEPLSVPLRLLDTRPSRLGALETTDAALPLAAGAVTRVDLSALSAFSGAATVAVNLTTLNQASSGFLQAYPCVSPADAVPPTAVLNYAANAVLANSALIALADDGFCVRSSHATHLIIDAVGTFAASNTYQPLTAPARLVDTRPGRPGLASDIDETTPFAAGEVRRYVVPFDAGLPQPSQYSALAVNIAAVGPATSGFVKAWPCASAATPPPATSVLNFRASTNTANASMLGVTDGGICVQPSAATHLIIDVTGTFTAQASAVSNERPLRLLDTRPFEMGTTELTAGSDVGAPLAAGEVITLTLPGQAGVPHGGVAGAAVVNITAVGNTATGFITVWACSDANSTPPTVSTLNFRPGAPTSNGALVSLSGVTMCVMASQATHLVVDVTGWHAASAA